MMLLMWDMGNVEAANRLDKQCSSCPCGSSGRIWGFIAGDPRFHCGPSRLRVVSFQTQADSFMRLTLTATALVCVVCPTFAGPDFGRDVFPILRRACFECHGVEKQKGGL